MYLKVIQNDPTYVVTLVIDVELCQLLHNNNP